MTLCEVAKATIGWSIGYLAWATLAVIGTIFYLPGKLSWHLAKNRSELRDAWQRIHAGTWQSPIFAALLPVAWLFIFPVAYPLVAFGIPALLLLFGSIASC